jgi:hypothetical protein
MSEPYWVPLGAAGGVLDSAGFGTSLPASPVDGQDFVLVDSLTAPTYSWRFRYLAAKATNKWLFVGGSPLRSEVATAQSTATTTYVDLGTVGPQATMPVAGDYVIRFGANINAAAACGGYVAVKRGAAATSDVDGVFAQYGSAAANANSVAREMTLAGLAAGLVLTLQYRAIAGTPIFSNRGLYVTPIAVGG